MRTLDPQSLTKHVDRLYRAAWALCGSREDAEDLVQETFARVLARTRLLSGDDELYYLMRVLRNTFLTSRRTASRRPVTVATLEDVVAADSRPVGQPERALEMGEVYSTIAALPEDRRLALVAVDVLGLSYREAARALRVGEGTVTTRLFRARRQVARELADEPDSPMSDSSTSASPTPSSPDLTDPPATRQPQIPTVGREETRAAGVLPSRGTP
jgi:RNA polymerase sigma-70 factor, ECF subfamily